MHRRRLIAGISALVAGAIGNGPIVVAACMAGNQRSVRSPASKDNLAQGLSPPPPPPPLPPLPPAPPPPPPQQVFLVFFDWGKYNIMPEGENVIELAAQQYKAGGSVKIQVTGYTDRSLSPDESQELSERMASNVANALVRHGVQRGDMVVRGRGQNDNRVPTGPGVQEPQNRRVEIVFP